MSCLKQFKMFFLLLTTFHLIVGKLISSKAYSTYTEQLIDVDYQELAKNYVNSGKFQITLSDFPKSQKILLIMCSQKPIYKISFNFLKVNSDCLHDDLSLFQKRNTQSIIIQSQGVIRDQIINNFNTMYTIYGETKPYIGVYSEQQSYFFIKIFQSDVNCHDQCQNQGICYNGGCICTYGYFANDCSIQALDLVKQQSLEPQKLYYLQIDKIQPLTFQLSRSVNYVLYCYWNQQYFNNDQINYSQQIILNSEMIKQCTQRTQYLIELTKSTYTTFFVLYIDENQEGVQINQNNTTDDSLALIYILTSVISCVVFLIGSCCFKYHCKSRPQESVLKNPLNVKILKNELEKYMPVQSYLYFYEKYPGIQDDKECIICLETYNEQDLVRMTYCTHIFHQKCLDIWLKSHLNCPSCRTSLEFSILEKHYKQQQRFLEKQKNQPPQEEQIINTIILVGSQQNILASEPSRRIITRLYGNSISPMLAKSPQSKVIN